MTTKTWAADSHPVNLHPLFLLSGRPDIFLGSGTLKKGPRYWLQKAGYKKSESREEAAWPLLFLNNNDPVFLHPAFCIPYFGPFFKVPDPKNISGRPDNLE